MMGFKSAPGRGSVALLAIAVLLVAACVLLATTGTTSASLLLQERLEMSPAAIMHLAAVAKKLDGAAPPRGVRK